MRKTLKTGISFLCLVLMLLALVCMVNAILTNLLPGPKTVLATELDKDYVDCKQSDDPVFERFRKEYEGKILALKFTLKEKPTEDTAHLYFRGILDESIWKFHYGPLIIQAKVVLVSRQAGIWIDVIGITDDLHPLKQPITKDPKRENW